MMVNWVLIGAGGFFGLFLLLYAGVAISSLCESTGNTLFSVAVGLCHVVSPVFVMFFGYRCFLRKLPLYGSMRTLLVAVLCAAVYFFIVAAWNRIVFRDAPARWEIGVLTALQLAVSGCFLYGFFYF